MYSNIRKIFDKSLKRQKYSIEESNYEIKDLITRIKVFHQVTQKSNDSAQDFSYIFADLPHELNMDYTPKSMSDKLTITDENEEPKLLDMSTKAYDYFKNDYPDAFKLMVYQLGIENLIDQFKTESRIQYEVFEHFWTLYQDEIISFNNNKIRQNLENTANLREKLNEANEKITKLYEDNKSLNHIIDNLKKQLKQEKDTMYTTAELYHNELSVKNKSEQDYQELKTNIDVILPHYEYIS